MSIVKDVFSSRVPNWAQQEAAQIPNSWAKATTDMRYQWPGIWMNRKAKRTRNKNSGPQLAFRQSQTGFREPPALSFPSSVPMIDFQALPEFNRSHLGY